MLGGGPAPTPVSIPVGFTTFPGKIWRTPRSWVEKAYPNVIGFHQVDKGGHFAAWEEPELFSEEIRAAFRPLRYDSPHPGLTATTSAARRPCAGQGSAGSGRRGGMGRWHGGHPGETVACGQLARQKESRS